MLHCAGGILKNEGPLAFYKVSLSYVLCDAVVVEQVSDHATSTSIRFFYAAAGHSVAAGRYRRVRVDTVRRTGVHEADICSNELARGARRR